MTSVVIQPQRCACNSSEVIVHGVTCKGRAKNKEKGQGFSHYNVWLGPHRLGMLLGPINGWDGWTAHPVSRHYRTDITPQQIADDGFWDKHVGPPSIEGFKSRRYAIDYLLRAEGYRRWEF